MRKKKLKPTEDLPVQSETSEPVEAQLEVNPTVAALRETAAEVHEALSVGGKNYVNETSRKAQGVTVMDVESDQVKVYRKDGTYIRTYSREVHGEKYQELAKQFVDKQNGQLA